MARCDHIGLYQCFTIDFIAFTLNQNTIPFLFFRRQGCMKKVMISHRGRTGTKSSFYESIRDDETVYRIRENGDLSLTPSHYKLIDLFSGAGGLTLGFTAMMGQAFKPLWANDVFASFI